jgi:hypothetical protein
MLSLRLPVNTQVGAYYNVVRPDNAAEWQLRIQIQFLFPKVTLSATKTRRIGVPTAFRADGRRRAPGSSPWRPAPAGPSSGGTNLGRRRTPVSRGPGVEERLADDAVGRIRQAPWAGWKGENRMIPGSIVLSILMALGLGIHSAAATAETAVAPAGCTSCRRAC